MKSRTFLLKLYSRFLFTMCPNTRHFDLIVIGGGISGLSTVFHLMKHKFKGNICLLEARDKFGGRISTSRTKIEEEKIEIGANWIHGIINNPIYEILYRRQVIDSSLESNKSFYNIQAKTCDNGQDVDTKLIQKVYEAYALIIKGASKFYESNDDKLEEIQKYNDSMGKYIEDEINKWIEKESSSDRNIIRGLFDSLIKRETCISGTHSMKEVSLQYFDQYKEYLGGNITIPRGYYSLIQVVLEEIQELDDPNQQRFYYFLDSEVSKIKWPGLEQSTTESPVIHIECSNGSLFSCDHLVSTITLGCLKKHAANLFVPKLPSYKMDCIQRMGFDVVDKIFLEYSSKRTIFEAFTKDGITVDEIMLLWNDNYYADTETEKAWYEKIYSIYRITDHCIQLWVSGKQARTLEQMTNDQINEQLTEQFRKIFRDPKFPRADNVIVTKWGTDPHSLGSYSFIRTSSSPEDIEKLAKPIYLKPNDEMPIIVFGGEATHKEYFSTVHGAYLSGMDTARNFVDISG